VHCVRLGSSFSVVFLCVPLSSDVYDSKNKTTPYERIFFSEMYVRTGQTIQFNTGRSYIDIS
jgi:hypothetical protein